MQGCSELWAITESLREYCSSSLDAGTTLCQQSGCSIPYVLMKFIKSYYSTTPSTQINQHLSQTIHLGTQPQTTTRMDGEVTIYSRVYEKAKAHSPQEHTRDYLDFKIILLLILSLMPFCEEGLLLFYVLCQTVNKKASCDLAECFCCVSARIKKWKRDLTRKKCKCWSVVFAMPGCRHSWELEQGYLFFTLSLDKPIQYCSLEIDI